MAAPSRWLLALLLTSACSPSAPLAPRAEVGPEPTPVAANAPSGAGPPPEAGAPAPPAAGPVVFSRDDFDAAVERARRSGKLVFVDAWAEWCHTCLSMDSVVLSDPSLGAFQGAYEFVALDTEKPVNEAFVQRFEMDTWPTFFVVRPKDLSLVGFWPGAASIREMQGFLEQSLDAAAELDGGNAPPHLRHFLAARHAHSVGNEALAVTEYQQAYASMPSDWPRKSELLFGYISALTKQKEFETCAELGKKHLHEVTGAAKPAHFAQRYFTCLGQLRTPDRESEVRRALGVLATLGNSPNPDMSFDDQVDALSLLATAYQMMGNEQDARAALNRRLAIAEKAAQDAKDPLEARAFDRIRVFAYLDMGQSERALELLQTRAKEHPHGYAIPELMAEVLQRLGRHDEGLAALDRAIRDSEGPRRCEYLEQKRHWLGRLKRTTEEAATLDRLIEERSKLRGSANQKKLEEAKRLRASMGTPGGG